MIVDETEDIESLKKEIQEKESQRQGLSKEIDSIEKEIVEVSGQVFQLLKSKFEIGLK